MRRNALRLAAAGLVALASPAVRAYVGPQDYVRGGLVALYDGVYNAKSASGVLSHADAPSAWQNLVSGAGDVALPAAATVAADGVTLDGITATAPNWILRVSGVGTVMYLK